MKKILVALCIPLIAAGASCTSKAQGNPQHEQMLENLVGYILNNQHFSKRQIDDEISKRALTLYIKRLDPTKMYLLQSDIDALRKYETAIDDQVMESRTDLFRTADSLYTLRHKEAATYYQEILSKKFDFNVNESFETDPEKRNFPKSKDDLKEYWRKYLKYQTLNRYISENERHEKDSRVKEKKSVEELRSDAQKYVLDQMKKRFDKKNELDAEDRFAMYINAIANAMDPHTEYFPPQEKENFDMGITGTLQGIGAQLQEADGYIKVESIVPGSASWRQGELKAGDVILRVAQGREAPVDVVDMPMKDAIKMIRGPKGTEVRLTVKKPDGSQHVIPIIRDIVVLEESFAKSAIFENEKTGKKIGYIFLPKFYFGSEGHGHSTSDDIRAEIGTLKAQGAEGIILDLRFNGGGSLQEAVSTSGLFIDQGPVVQVKDNAGKTQVLYDRDAGTAWDGPVIVMINTFSASASEIVSGALKDYKRAIIVGSPSTFGKGTVQTFTELDKWLQPEVSSGKSLGALKFTIQQFYRVNGVSTQYLGVTPDVVLPDVYSANEAGERSLEYSMPVDSITPQRYMAWNKSYDLNQLRSNSQKRLTSNEAFRLLNQSIEFSKKEKQNSLEPLKEDEYLRESTERKNISKAFNELKTEMQGIKVMSNQKPTEDAKASEAKKKDWENSLRKDIYIQEVMNIMGDMLAQNTSKK